MSVNKFAEKIAQSKWFQNLSLGLILLAAAILGLETNPNIIAEYGSFLHLLDKIILGLFTLEILIRIAAVNGNLIRYFRDPWNIFDFAIVAICYLPLDSQFASVARLVRVFRALRLLKAIPQLRLIVSALINSVSSMGYVGMLMFLVFYVYAIIGVFKFGPISPENFGSLGKALFSLFQIVTLEGWVELLEPLKHQYPIGSTIYFISFIFFGTLIVLNLFIGVIVNGMDQEKMEQENDSGLNDSDAVSQIKEIRTALDKLEKKLKRG
jgi:voltage-gated sodium channel